MIKHINGEEFQTEVLNNGRKVLVDFYADWCGPCKMVAPVLEKIASERDDFDIVKINVDDNQDLAMKYAVMSIPTMILFKESKAVSKIIGYAEEPVIVDFIEKN